MAINAQSVFPGGGGDPAASSGGEVTKSRQQTVYVNLNTFTLRSINKKLNSIITAIQSDIRDNRSEENKQDTIRKQGIDAERKNRIETNIERETDIKVPQLVQKQVTKVQSFFGRIGEALTALFAGWVTNQIVENWDTIERTVINVYAATRQTITNISNIIKNVFAVIRNVVDTGISAIKGAFEFVKDAMGTFYGWVEGAMNFIKNLVEGAANLVKPVTEPAVEAAGNAAQATGNFIERTATAADNATGNIASKTRDAIGDAASAAVEGTKNLITGAKDAITGTGTKVISTKGHTDTGPGYTIQGQTDEQGRPVVFSKEAAAAFEKMVADSKGVVKGTDIASSQRTVAKNKKENGAEKSKHLYGLGMDIHGNSKAWIIKNGKKYGWVHAPYGGPNDHGGHFEFKGPAAPAPAKTPSNKDIPKEKPVEAKPAAKPAADVKPTEVKVGSTATPAPAEKSAESVTPMMGETAAPSGPRSSDSNATDASMFGPYDSGEMDASGITPQQNQTSTTSSSIQPVNNANEKIATMESSVPSSQTQVVQLPSTGGGGTTTPSDLGPINAGSMSGTGATKFPGARSSNPDNFYVLFSHSVYNVMAI